MPSLIDPTKPEDGVPAAKADLRANLQAAKAEIEALQAGGTALPAGGLTGQRLTKLSDADFDVGWQTPSGATASPLIFAKDYGAVADGQDRRAELLDAIAAARGKTLVIEGMIRVGSEIRLAAAESGTTIIGAGPSGHGVRAHDPDSIAESQLLRVEGSEGSEITDVSFHNVEIDGNRAEATTAGFACVRHRHARRIRWKGCYIHDNPGIGENLFSIAGNTEDTWMIENRFWSAGRNCIDLFAQSFTNHPNRRVFIIANSIQVGAIGNRNGILCSSDLAFLNNRTKVIVQGNHIFNCEVNAGIRVTGACDAVIDGNWFENNRDNIRATTRSNICVITNNFFKSTFSDSYSHIILRNESDSSTDGTSYTIGGNVFEPTSGLGIGVAADNNLINAVSASIDNNVLRGCPILVSRPGGAALFATLSGNIVRGVSSGNGIEVNNVNNAVVTGNRIDGSGTNGILAQNLDKPIVAHNSVTGTWGTPIATSNVTNAIGLDPQTNQL